MKKEKVTKTNINDLNSKNKDIKNIKPLKNTKSNTKKVSNTNEPKKTNRNVSEKASKVLDTTKKNVNNKDDKNTKKEKELNKSKLTIKDENAKLKKEKTNSKQNKDKNSIKSKNNKLIKENKQTIVKDNENKKKTNKSTIVSSDDNNIKATRSTNKKENNTIVKKDVKKSKRRTNVNKQKLNADLEKQKENQKLIDNILSKGKISKKSLSKRANLKNSNSNIFKKVDKYVKKIDFSSIGNKLKTIININNNSSNEQIEKLDIENKKEINKSVKKSSKSTSSNSQSDSYRKLYKELLLYRVIIGVLAILMFILSIRLIKIDSLNTTSNSDVGNIEHAVEKDKDIKRIADPSFLEEWNTNHDKTFVKDDYVGQIIFESKLINEPVVQGETNDTYLRRNYETYKYEILGPVFVDSECNIGEDQNLILYGHNMTTEGDPEHVMRFSPLHRFEEQTNYEENKIIYIAYQDRVDEYVVASVYPISIIVKEDGAQYLKNGEPKYYLTNYSDSQFSEYKEAIKEKQLYNTGVELENGDKLLTLQTCYEYSNDKLIVLAKYIDSLEYDIK